VVDSKNRENAKLSRKNLLCDCPELPISKMCLGFQILINAKLAVLTGLYWIFQSELTPWINLVKTKVMMPQNHKKLFFR
jgi:hypothetical protein